MDDTFFSTCLYFIITFYFHAWLTSWLNITSFAHQLFSFKILWFIFSLPLGPSHCKRIVWIQPNLDFFVSSTCFLENFLLDGFVYSCNSNILSLRGFFFFNTLGPFRPKSYFDNCVHTYLITKSCWFFYLLIIWNHCYVLHFTIGVSGSLLYKPAHCC